MTELLIGLIAGLTVGILVATATYTHAWREGYNVGVRWSDKP